MRLLHLDVTSSSNGVGSSSECVRRQKYMLALSCSFVLFGDMFSGGAQHRSEVLLSKYTRRTAVANAEEDVSRPLGQDGFRGSSRSKSPYGVHHFQNLPENFSSVLTSAHYSAPQPSRQTHSVISSRQHQPYAPTTLSLPSSSQALRLR